MHSAGRNLLLEPSRRTLVAVAAASLLIPMGGVACQTAQIPASPSPATAAPSVRVEWEDAGLALPVVQEGGSVVVVNGTGEVEVLPDRARIAFAVETEGQNATEAGQTNAALIDRVSSALRSAGSGLPGFRMETVGYSLSPRYGPIGDDRTRAIVGYTARNTLQVVVDQVEGLGTLIDEALAAGANRISGLTFELRDPEPNRHEAVRRAIGNARAEAEVIAEALGMALGPPVEVQGEADIFFPRGMAMAADRAIEFQEQVPTAIEAGPQRVFARVTIRYRLDPAP
jgi:hypothetical protein